LLYQVANKKQRDTAAADAEMKAKREAEAANEGGQQHASGGAGAADLLAAEDDEDVIF
jgi:V-type H+-transporting ATPase subunit D